MAALGGPQSAPIVGLRERRKVKTRNTIRTAAMELFAEQGYGGTTVEQIAQRAEVSHTTFFRYFQTKEQVVISDDLDDQKKAILAAVPPGMNHFELIRRLITQIHRMIVTDEWASRSDRMDLIDSEPALRLAYQLESERTFSDAVEYLADYTGHDVDDFELRVFVAAIGGFMFHFKLVRGPHDQAGLQEALAAFDLLEQGLPL